MDHLVLLKDLKGVNIVFTKQFESRDRDRPEFSNKYFKIFFFIFREGIIAASRKYLAHSIPQKRYLTFVVIEHGNNKYINISMQFQSNPDHYIINNCFYQLGRDIDFSIIPLRLEYYLKEFNQFAGKENPELFQLDIENNITFEVTENKIEGHQENGLIIYGLGGYVRMFIMHHFKKFRKLACIDYKADVAAYFQKKYGFKHQYLLPSESFALLRHIRKPAVIIATYHSDHAQLACQIFNNNPNASIFIEKPPVVTLEDLRSLIEIYKRGANIEIGFNRRYIPFNQYVQNKVKEKTVIVTCSVKEVLITDIHWYLWENQGTRITGNAVHWFDLANFWINSIPVEINVMTHPLNKENAMISVLYANGSILNLTMSDQGNSLRGVQERIEIRFDEETILIDDYLTLTHIKSNGMKYKKRKLIRDKGHNNMYKHFRKSITNGSLSKYTLYDLIRTSVVTYYASEMIKDNRRNEVIKDKVLELLKI